MPAAWEGIKNIRKSWIFPSKPTEESKNIVNGMSDHDLSFCMIESSKIKLRHEIINKRFTIRYSKNLQKIK